MPSQTGWSRQKSDRSVRAVSDDELAHIRNVTGEDRPTADELIEIVRTYAEERRSLGRQAMASSHARSVQRVWGRVLVEEMTTLLEVISWD